MRAFSRSFKKGFFCYFTKIFLYRFTQHATLEVNLKFIKMIKNSNAVLFYKIQLFKYFPTKMLFFRFAEIFSFYICDKNYNQNYIFNVFVSNEDSFAYKLGLTTLWYRFQEIFMTAKTYI